MNSSKPLRFRPDESFRILQLADTQQSAQVSLDTVRLIDALVEATQPDLVVFTGDQIKGYARDFHRGKARKKVLELADDGVGAIELCGAFGEEKARELAALTDNKIVIGYVENLPEHGELVQQFFGQK